MVISQPGGMSSGVTSGGREGQRGRKWGCQPEAEGRWPAQSKGHQGM